MISDSAKMLYQKVMENFQGEVREKLKKSGHPGLQFSCYHRPRQLLCSMLIYLHFIENETQLGFPSLRDVHLTPYMLYN